MFFALQKKNNQFQLVPIIKTGFINYATECKLSQCETFLIDNLL